MKIVKNLTGNNISGTGIVRRPDLDFDDDGTKFRMFGYKGLLISVTKGSDEIFLYIRVDNKCSFPNSDWRKTEEYKLCDKYNGGIHEFDMDELIKDCDKILAKVDELNEAFSNEVIDVAPLVSHLTNELSNVMMKSIKYQKFNWWKASKHELDNFHYYYNRLIDTETEIYRLIDNIKNNKIEKKWLKEYLNRKEEYGYIIWNSAKSFYIEKCEELYKKYNEEKTA